MRGCSEMGGGSGQTGDGGERLKRELEIGCENWEIQLEREVRKLGKNVVEQESDGIKGKEIAREKEIIAVERELQETMLEERTWREAKEGESERTKRVGIMDRAGNQSNRIKY